MAANGSEALPVNDSLHERRQRARKHGDKPLQDRLESRNAIAHFDGYQPFDRAETGPTSVVSKLDVFAAGHRATRKS